MLRNVGAGVLVLLIARFALATGSGAVALSQPSAATVEVSVQVDLLSSQGQERRPVRPGETLYAGDTIALRVWVSRDAYVYAVQVSPKGETLRIFPGPDTRQADVLITANQELTLPAKGGITLDSEVGEENILVVAAPRPLAELAPEQEKRLFAPGLPAQQRLPGELASAAAGTGPPPPPPEAPRPPPQPLAPKDRVPPGRYAASPVILRAQSRHGQVANVRFSFQHRTRYAPQKD